MSDSSPAHEGPTTGRRDVGSTSDRPLMSGRHRSEPHQGGISSRLNWLRAGVLGANDGIVSTAGLVVGVAGATASRGAIFTAGISGLVAGAVAMALGEFVSVSSQRDTERALLNTERHELTQDPASELTELAAIYEAKGMSAATARTVAAELTEHDAFAAHVEAELRLDPDALTSPRAASIASGISFSAGAALPLLAILLAPAAVRVPVTFIVVLLALAMTGTLSATLGGASRQRAVIRIVVGGALGMLITYAVGRAFGAAVA